MRAVAKHIIFAMVGIILFLLLALLLLYIFLAPENRPASVADESTIRQLQAGEVIGFIDDGVSTWLGIPYAEAPVGELRWKAPRPAGKWAHRRESLSFGSPCPQNLQGTMRGVEDCLFINIWSPHPVTSSQTSNNKYPVMFWIHGGGNSIGEAATSIYNGARLSREHKVVIVSINYRLGPLGWFRHPALRGESDNQEDNSGNYGTLDIIKALCWVKDNIALFQGDPDNVTLFGESAGGVNVLSMMASPLAKGLFHKAISQSGGLNLTPITRAENFKDDVKAGDRLSSREIVNTLLISLGKADSQTQAKQLQQAMTNDALSALMGDLSAEQLLGLYTGSFAGMLGNPDLFADGYVLPAGRITLQIFSDINTYNAVPVILGSNRDEMKLFMAFSSDHVKKTLGIPSGFRNLSAYNRDNRYATDVWKATAVDQLATTMTNAQGSGVFAYRFDVDDWRNFGLIKLKVLFGAAHALELPFVFGNFPNPLSVIFPSSMEAEFNTVSAAMRSYWAEFAYSGTPGNGQSSTFTTWLPWDNSPDPVPRLMVFDTLSDNGIRMTSDRLSMKNLRVRLLADKSYTSQDEHCSIYKRMFRGDAFNADEYANLGKSGCPQ